MTKNLQYVHKINYHVYSYFTQLQSCNLVVSVPRLKTFQLLHKAIGVQWLVYIECYTNRPYKQHILELCFQTQILPLSYNM